jgi:hypothetical protein
VAILMPTALQAPTAKQLGFVWSGRYGLAIAAGVPILASLGLGQSGRLGPRATRWLVGVVVTVVAIVQVGAHWADMRRYVVGDNGPLWYFGHSGWTPPLPAWSLLVAMVVFSAGLALLTYRVATADVGPSPGRPLSSPWSSPAVQPVEEPGAGGRGDRHPGDRAVEAGRPADAGAGV